MFRHISPDHIPGIWGEVAALLAPAIRQDRKVTIQSVYDKLMSEQCTLLKVDHFGADGVFVFEVFEENEKIICWASYIAGTVPGGPRQWLKTMREIMTEFEAKIKAAGCVQNRIGGRDWRRIFPDYRLFDGDTFELRKDI